MRIFFIILCLFAQPFCYSQKQISVDSLFFSVKLVSNFSANNSFDLLLQTEKKFSNKNNVINAAFTIKGKKIVIDIKGITEPQIKEYAVGPAAIKFNLAKLKNINYTITITKSDLTSTCKLILRKSYYKLMIKQNSFLGNLSCIKQPIHFRTCNVLPMTGSGATSK